MNVQQTEINLSCPVPIGEYKHVLLAHGGGGKLSQRLIHSFFLSQFNNELLEPLHDGAILSVEGTRLAFSTDSYVVNPIFFPGGNIGELAIYGTVNDLAMCGAKPLYLSAGFIIEEGFSMEELWQVVCSMKNAATNAGVTLVTGDTKVVERGKGDKIFINTSGIGVIENGVNINPKRAAVGDKIILSGAIGMHGIAIMSVREGLEFSSPVISDTAPLNGLVSEMLNTCNDIHVLRDPTRGGVASALNEIAGTAKVGIVINENDIPVPEGVQGACEILGLDPLYIANEGKLLAFVPPFHAERVLETMKKNTLGKESVIIGEVVTDHAGLVVMNSRIGGTRIVDMLTGEQLPRIC
ncbi:MAG: hydrogenase expression/formation protein HypE [Ignavibacteriae bacterium]|nr:hydrogenase expression/formation protein HypE [Ignavibacteriota bacterium]